jgi:ADP-ribose pyrophosphatase YjhB (NUDIX family)
MPISPYLRSLRERVGQRLILLPSVAVLARDAAGRLLLVRNRDSGEWQTAGGAVDPDEDPADAAVREAFEESGYVVELTRLIGVYGGPEFRLAYPNGDLCSYVAIAFAARVVAGAARPDGAETSAVAWFARSELDRLPMAPHTRLLVQAALDDGPSFRPPRWRPEAG